MSLGIGIGVSLVLQGQSGTFFLKLEDGSSFLLLQGGGRLIL